MAIINATMRISIGVIVLGIIGLLIMLAVVYEQTIKNIIFHSVMFLGFLLRAAMVIGLCYLIGSIFL